MAAIAAAAISAGLASVAAGPAHAARFAAMESAADPQPAAAVRPAATQYSIPGGLAGVAGASAANAWAVGYAAGSAASSKVLMLHWNGAKWSRVTSPKVLTVTGALSGITVVSATDAWAVGFTGTYASEHTLLLHWNGTVWKQVPSPSLAGGLSTVAATSADNAWAVGSTDSYRTLIERWNGTAWKRVPSPSPGSVADLQGVAASSVGNAWAVGDTFSGGISGSFDTLIERWNGTAWKRVPSPSPDASEGLADFLGGVAVTSVGSAWAVGDASCGCGPGLSVIERWNGTVWKKVPSPSPGGGAVLSSVTAVSVRTAWTVGETGSGDGPTKTLTLWWNGTAWKKVPSPSPGVSASLSAVTATSARNAWAVGDTSKINHGSPETLILHWNGTTWK